MYIVNVLHVPSRTLVKRQIAHPTDDITNSRCRMSVWCSPWWRTQEPCVSFHTRRNEFQVLMNWLAQICFNPRSTNTNPWKGVKCKELWGGYKKKSTKFHSRHGFFWASCSWEGCVYSRSPGSNKRTSPGRSSSSWTALRTKEFASGKCDIPIAILTHEHPTDS